MDCSIVSNPFFVPVFLVATFSCPGIRILGPILFGETVW